jgi:hypothetical protein
MSTLMSASSQTPHSILCVVGARLNFGMPEEIKRILTDQIPVLPFSSERNCGRVPEIRDGQASTRIAAEIRS